MGATREDFLPSPELQKIAARAGCAAPLRAAVAAGRAPLLCVALGPRGGGAPARAALDMGERRGWGLPCSAGALLRQLGLQGEPLDFALDHRLTGALEEARPRGRPAYDPREHTLCVVARGPELLLALYPTRLFDEGPP